ncbi:MAG TPA: hypothetical protein VFR83_00545, partial [Burkholderiales bacterium]|nr:hypothetical protein [Burkholderiales bacterium]
NSEKGLMVVPAKAGTQFKKSAPGVEDQAEREDESTGKTFLSELSNFPDGVPAFAGTTSSDHP